MALSYTREVSQTGPLSVRPFDVRQIISLSTHSLVRTVWRMYVKTPAMSTHSLVRTIWRVYVKTPARSTYSLVRTFWRVYLKTPARSTHSLVRTIWRMYVKTTARCAIVTWCLQSGGRGRGINKTANKKDPKYFPQTTKKTEHAFPQYGYNQKRDNSGNRLATRRREETALKTEEKKKKMKKKNGVLERPFWNER